MSESYNITLTESQVNTIKELAKSSSDVKQVQSMLGLETKQEIYPEEDLKPILRELISAKAMIEKMASVTDIFQIRESNPELYKFYMKINDALCDGFDLKTK